MCPITFSYDRFQLQCCSRINHIQIISLHSILLYCQLTLYKFKVFDNYGQTIIKNWNGNGYFVELMWMRYQLDSWYESLSSKCLYSVWKSLGRCDEFSLMKWKQSMKRVIRFMTKWIETPHISLNKQFK